MTNNELHYMDLMEVGRQIQSRQRSSEEVTRHMLERVDAVDTRLHSYVTVMADQALRDARAADKEIAAGQARGPLHGVPLAVKDLLWTAGTATSHGMPILRDHVPAEDATTVRRLRDAGAVLLGKLQQTEGAFADHHPDVTAPVNPWGETLWSGVSSSGSGVATAAGLCFGSLGTDTGGSIRFPSAANGVTGLKPTWGRVSRYGAFELAASLDHIGPIARNTVDAAAILGAIAGADPLDPTAARQPVPDYLALMTRGVTGLRLGFDPDWGMKPADQATQAVVREALKVLESAGAEPREVRFPDTDQAVADWSPLCGLETAVAHEETYPARRSEYGPVLSALIEVGRSLDAMDYQKLQLRRADFRGRVDALFDKVGLLLIPAVAYAGVTVETMASFADDEALLGGMMRYTCPFDLSGHPTLTLPGGVTAEGAPVAWQLVAPHFREDLLIRGGWAFQRITDWHRRHPRI
ncbi:amidase [Alloalcanivorax xenomutans]|uniref:amidase n=1 Tax=Alloalcanivorax xenomutans TaxID=1094342 RepID=UPI0029349A54|nr:amidase [Alloalcanivorax xenomutans]WOD30373.1 amidase [Alloalcanivorax xenomutans]